MNQNDNQNHLWDEMKSSYEKEEKFEHSCLGLSKYVKKTSDESNDAGGSFALSYGFAHNGICNAGFLSGR